MKINNSVREKYMELCWRSSFKCNSYEEVDYKIKRAVELGKEVYKTKSKNHTYKQYYDLCFIVKDDTVIDFFKNNIHIPISEDKKIEHERKHYNIVV